MGITMARATVETATASERRLRMTYDEWLALEWEGLHSEWVDGEVIIFMPPKVVHQRLLLFLARFLAGFVDRHRLGEVFVAPMEMRLVDQRASREPDLLYVRRENLERVTPDRLDGPADLVVELVSDDSVTRDRVAKRNEYAAAGIPEYWVLDPRPRRHRASFLLLDDTGMYREVPLDERGRFHSTILPGFWLDPTWLWQEPLPDVETLLAEIASGR
jgi:Uma2 family endonuclease